MILDCFKAYDVRGKLGETLDTAISRRIGRAFAECFGPGTIVVGHDARASSPALKLALVDGLRDRGAGVIDIGLCGTEEVYFATGHLDAAGGIMVTASHNPIDYNGMKLVGPESRPIDPARMRDELGWRPSVTVEEGLARTVDWYLANEDWWRPLLERDGVRKRLGTG